MPGYRWIELSQFSQPFDFTRKEKLIEQYVGYMYTRTQSMFEYRGLPDTIPKKMLELYLQVNGSCIFTQVNGGLYVLAGAYGGEPDIYYLPTIYSAANPRVKNDGVYKIGDNCILVLSDTMGMGLKPMYTKYASLLAENDISMRMANINSRMTSLISAPDDKTKFAAEKYLSDVEIGKMGVIAENAFLDGIRVQPYTSASDNRLTGMIEYQQYLKASWYNELGLQANYNMKRESINSNEAQLNDDALLPLVEEMLNCRKLGIEKVNEMYGTSITVDFSSSWKIREEETKNVEVETEQEYSGQPENGVNENDKT